MKQAEIKKNILKIATDVFRDTQVLFAYLYGSYVVNQAHQFSDLDIGIYVPRLPRREKLNLEMALALKIDKKLKQGPASDVRIINPLPLAVVGAIQVAKGLCRFFCRAGGKRYFSAAAWTKSETDDKIQESACPFIWRD